MTTETCVLRDSEAIEAFFLEMTGMKPGFVQLSPGLINLQLETVDLGGVSLIWTRSEGRQRWRDVMTEDGLHLGIAIESDGPIRFRGQDVDRAEIAVWHPGVEMDFIMRGPLTSLDIGVDKDLLDELGWSLSGAPLAATSGAPLKALVSACEQATSAFRSQAGPGAGWAAYWRDHILDLMEPVLQPWMTGSPVRTADSLSSDYQIVCLAEDFLDGLGETDGFDVESLSRGLGVSKRTVFRSFRQTLGMGPRKYFELKRLYRLRRRLREGDAHETTVTAIAGDLGFSELGRLAGLYRQHFGESPSETLRRG